MSEKLLITGAGGFIGSHLTEICVEKGYDVKVFIHYNSKNNWGWLEKSPIRNDIEVYMGDIRDYDSVFDAMRNVKMVFHLAALIGIPYSYISPIAYIRTNIEGTYNILQASLKYSIDNILITSTSETYGTAQYVPIDEMHPIVGQSPYSATKIAADQLSISYYRSFRLPVKIVRPFNTYGPRQSARAIIPTIISQMLEPGKKIKIGNLSPTRDLTYVKDTAKSFIEISKVKELNGEVVNIGSSKEIAIGELVELIGKLMDSDYDLIIDEKRIRPEKSEVQRLICDNNKLLKHTNWKPEYNIEKGLTETISWIKKNLKIYKTSFYNI
jgi:NAD dependent epimerase/dehydratase